MRSALLALQVAASFDGSAIPASWGALQPGTNRVGFHAWVARDTTRRGTDGARPVQVSVWFPVSAARRVKLLRYEDYVGLASSETGGGDAVRDRGAAVAAFTAFLVANGVPESATRKWLASPMFASRESLPGDSTRPIVLIGQGNGQAAYSQAVLAEFLASRGFVVVTTPSPLRTGATLQSEADVYGVAKTQATDLEFAAREVAARGLGRVGRVAVVGHSFGARAGLLLLSSGFTAELVSLDGGIGMEAGKSWLEGAPVIPANVRGRITHLYETTDSLLRPDFALLRSMTGTTRELLLVQGIAHWQFTSFGTITQAFPAVSPGAIGPSSPQAAAEVVRYTACRLEQWAESAGDGNGCALAGRVITPTERWPAVRAPDAGSFAACALSFDARLADEARTRSRLRAHRQRQPQ